MFQAILPLRGKILNVEKAMPHRVFENEEIKNTEDFRSIKNKISNDSDQEIRDKTILIFKERVSSNGQVTKGFVAVKSE